jgi:hypothetical protein
MQSLAPSRRVSLTGSFAAFQSVAFGAFPIAFTALGLVHYAQRDVLAIDFHRQYWIVGNRVVDGLSPYDRGWQDIAHGVGFPYSALDALLFVPFGLLPHTAADWTFTGLVIAAAMLTLRVLDVRDWRLYGVALLWAPVVSAWQTANLTLLLGLGIAGMWRVRDRPMAVGGLMALLITVKVFLWPLAIWLIVTRRFAGLAWTVVAGIVLNAVTWAIIGFDQISAFRSLGDEFTRVDEQRSYNLLHLALDHGAGRTAAYVLQLLAVALVAGACVRLGRRGQDRSALILSVGICLLAAPVIWLHYFALLLVPLALGHPTLSPIWLLPIALFGCPVHEANTVQLVATLAVDAVIIGRAAAHAPPVEWIGGAPAWAVGTRR